GHIDATLLQINRGGAGSPLQTTLTAVVTGGRDLFFAHVGHSRAYLLRDDALIALTRDHTRRPDMAGPPLLDLENMASDLHHILTRALGAGAIDPPIDGERPTLSGGDLLLPCTKSLTHVRSARDITSDVGPRPRVERKV